MALKLSIQGLGSAPIVPPVAVARPVAKARDVEASSSLVVRANKCFFALKSHLLILVQEVGVFFELVTAYLC